MGTTQMFTACIDRVRFTNHEDFTIFVGHDEDKPFERVTVKMQAAGREGQRWVVRGKNTPHPQYGDQFEASFAVRALPRTDSELTLFLNDMGWGWTTATRVVEHLQAAGE